jgi:hypothetical protein
LLGRLLSNSAFSREKLQKTLCLRVNTKYAFDLSVPSLTERAAQTELAGRPVPQALVRHRVV